MYDPWYALLWVSTVLLHTFIQDFGPKDAETREGMMLGVAAERQKFPDTKRSTLFKQ